MCAFAAAAAAWVFCLCAEQICQRVKYSHVSARILTYLSARTYTHSPCAHLRAIHMKSARAVLNLWRLRSPQLQILAASQLLTVRQRAARRLSVTHSLNYRAPHAPTCDKPSGQRRHLWQLRHRRGCFYVNVASFSFHFTFSLSHTTLTYAGAHTPTPQHRCIYPHGIAYNQAHRQHLLRHLLTDRFVCTVCLFVFIAFFRKAWWIQFLHAKRQLCHKRKGANTQTHSLMRAA